MKLRIEALDDILKNLQEERDFVFQAVEAARIAATDSESKAEDQHDTRGVEASYLAAGQGKRLGELNEQLAKLEQLRQIAQTQVVGLGSLVELLQETPAEKSSYVFLAPTGGGTAFHLQGKPGLVISPASPLGDVLMGQKTDDTVEIEHGDETRTYRIVRLH